MKSDTELSSTARGEFAGRLFGPDLPGAAVLSEGRPLARGRTASELRGTADRGRRRCGAGRTGARLAGGGANAPPAGTPFPSGLGRAGWNLGRAAAGISPASMPSFFAKLAEKEGAPGPAVHPSPLRRPPRVPASRTGGLAQKGLPASAFSKVGWDDHRESQHAGLEFASAHSSLRAGSEG